MKKPTRTLSGVTPVAVMTVGDCPGECLYCPRGEKAAQSYTGFEPAAMRGKMFDFDPARQVQSRISQLSQIGHPTSKIELILMGGTFPAMSKDYVEGFVKGCFDALNGEKSGTLEEAQLKNERAEHRVVGMTLETRPDHVDPQEFLRLGATRVELGVQAIDDEVYERVRRGHRVKDVADATRRLKEAGFKVCYHMMPGLPGADDRESLKLLFSDERFMPDMLKIYPTLVMEGTELYEMWKRGEYDPPELGPTVKLLAEFKESIPSWVRIMRVNRDIPVGQIAAGIKKSHIRQLVWRELEGRGTRCDCIRCREVGRREPSGPFSLERQDYKASGGREVFLSFEAGNKSLAAILRLRLDERATVRELHVYGPETEVGEEGDHTQHQGYGEQLLKEAERISQEAGHKALRIISGIGAREYYRKLGYRRRNSYMIKMV